jgi:hypothetical protein
MMLRALCFAVVCFCVVDLQGGVTAFLPSRVGGRSGVALYLRGPRTAAGEEIYLKTFKSAQSMRVAELRNALEARGVSTTSFFEKTEFVKAYAQSVADEIDRTVRGSSSSSSSSSYGSRGNGAYAYPNGYSSDYAASDYAASSYASSSSSSSSTSTAYKTVASNEPFDPTYRDVIIRKIDRQFLVGVRVIDTGLSP